MFEHMKNLIYWLIGGGLLYAGYKFASKGRTARLLNIKLRNVRLNPINQAAVVLEVINPTNESISFNSIVADVVVNNFALATVNYQQPTVIAANSSKSITIRFRINPLEAGGFILNLFSKKDKSDLGEVNLKGTLSGEGITAPIDITQKLRA